VKIAVSGKGGVGKTTVSALLARAFLERGMRVLAIDADPNPNLAILLGVPLNEAEKIIPISENGALIEEKTGVKPESYGGVFRISFRVDDIAQRYGVRTPSGIDLIVMGAVRAASQGCMCPANALIRALLKHLLMQPDEIAVVDMEAGVEHLGRGTVEYVDAMLVVTEPSMRSLETARRISVLSEQIGIKRIFLVGNRVMGEESEIIDEYSKRIHVPLLGLIPYDDNLRALDVQSKKTLGASPTSPGLEAVKRLGETLLKL
jgi:CO dehydrogenase maturation factor